MPMIRKVLAIGNSKAITIPKSWLDYYEKQRGQPIRAVTMEVNRVLKIEPFLPKEKKEAETQERRGSVE